MNQKQDLKNPNRNSEKMLTKVLLSSLSNSSTVVEGDVTLFQHQLEPSTPIPGAFIAYGSSQDTKLSTIFLVRIVLPKLLKTIAPFVHSIYFEKTKLHEETFFNGIYHIETPASF